MESYSGSCSIAGIPMIIVIHLQLPLMLQMVWQYKIYKYIIIIKTGHRPTIEHEVPPVFASLMERCWHQNAEMRPTFDGIKFVLLRKFIEFPFILTKIRNCCTIEEVVIYSKRRCCCNSCSTNTTVHSSNCMYNSIN